MNSHARLTYTQVWKAVGEEDAQAQAQMGALLPQVQQLHRLYQVLAKARAQRGAIEFESSEVRFVLDNRGEVTQAGMLMRNDAHKLIEECMIVANVQAAHFLLNVGVQAPYRIHERPPESKYADLLEFLKEFKLSLPAWGKVQPGDFTKLLKRFGSVQRRHCWSRCCCAAKVWRCIRLTIAAISVWRWMAMRTLLRQFGAILIFWCTVQSSMRSVVLRRTASCIRRVTWSHWHWCVLVVSVVPMRRNARWISAIVLHGWNGMLAVSLMV